MKPPTSSHGLPKATHGNLPTTMAKRPPRIDNRVRDGRIMLEFTPDELDQFAAMAEAEGETRVSAYMRRILRIHLKKRKSTYPPK
jgi:hypothetical protein